MSKRLFPTDIYAQSQKALNAWAQIDDQITFGALNIAALTMTLNKARGIDETLTDLENKLTNLRNQRDEVNEDLWDKLKRLRAGMKASYGDDSSQYEMVGGTRMSERKTSRRTATPA